MTSGLALAVPTLAYAVLGSSQILAIGPTSLLVDSCNEQLEPNDGTQLSQRDFTPQVASSLALICGSLQICMALLNFGSVFKYLSPALVASVSTAMIVREMGVEICEILDFKAEVTETASFAQV